MNVKTKCEQCGKPIKVWLSHYLIRKILKLNGHGFDLLCTQCYFDCNYEGVEEVEGE